MKNRCISENLRELLTVVEYCQQNDVKAVLTVVDFEKAFDTVAWEVMKQTMLKLGLPPILIKVDMMCYQDFTMTVGNNGYTTSEISIQRENKQGCLLSALQFLHVIEMIGLKFKQDTNIQSIDIYGVQNYYHSTLMIYGPLPSLKKAPSKNNLTSSNPLENSLDYQLITIKQKS